MSRFKLKSMSGAKANIFTIGEAGETHTVDYTTKNIGLSEELLILLRRELNSLREDVYCFSVNNNEELEVCRMVDINFQALEKE